MTQLKQDRRFFLKEDVKRRSLHTEEETILHKGDCVLALREHIDYVRGTHKVQVKKAEKVLWVNVRYLRRYGDD
jgi:hypothetical protein